MRSFYLKLALILLLPLGVIAIYFINDPFKVLYRYDTYYKNGTPGHIDLNKDFISTETWINNDPIYHYDSYIFGNSRSMAYHVNSWEKYINSKGCYHFDASQESLYGIEKKIEFLDEKGGAIKNVLFILDYSVLMKTTNDSGHLFIKDPKTSKENNIAFQVRFLKVYLDPIFLKHYLVYLCTNGAVTKNKNDIADGNFLIATDRRTYNPISNELFGEQVEQSITSNTDSFYKTKQQVFYERRPLQKYSNPVIGQRQISMLQNMQKILTKHGTNFKIVISPLYDQEKINPADIAILNNIFGAKNVFDFSGINEITQNVHNYYETSHYRPIVGDKILDSIYNARE